MGFSTKSLFLSVSLSLASLRADVLTNAIDALNIAKVEQELAKQHPLQADYKQALLKNIAHIIAKKKGLQGSFRKYLNRQLILGSIATYIGLSYLGSSANSNTLTTLSDRMSTKVMADTDEQIRENPGLNPSVVLRELKRNSDNDIFFEGLVCGTAASLLIVKGIEKLWAGLTAKNLKSDYAKALAIKSLIEAAPVIQS